MLQISSTGIKNRDFSARISKVFQEDLEFELDLKEFGFNFRGHCTLPKLFRCRNQDHKDTNFEGKARGLLLSRSLPGQHHEHIGDSEIRG